MDVLETPDSVVARTTLPNGIVVLTEELPHVRTAAFAVFQLQGSRDETDEEAGLTHFLEHFLFRGTLAGPVTASRTARDIAIEMDVLGGDVDAVTQREQACWSAEVVAELLPRAVDLVTDLVARPSLPAAELERERSVVREEIRSFEDDPIDVASRLSLARCFPGHPLGRPIEGTLESLGAFTPEGVHAFWRRRHVADNLLVCAAGRLTHADLVAAVAERLGELPGGRPPLGPAAVPQAPGTHVERLSHLEHAQLILCLPGLPAGHADGPALAVLVAALGSGASSRLWQRIREDEGLAYDVSLGTTGYRDAGRLTFHAATSPDNVARALAIFEEETTATCRELLPLPEFERAVQSLRAGIVLGMESPSERLDELAHGQIVYGRHLTIDDHLARLEAVTREQVLGLARRLLPERRRNLLVLGPPGTPGADRLRG